MYLSTGQFHALIQFSTVDYAATAKMVKTFCSYRNNFVIQSNILKTAARRFRYIDSVLYLYFDNAKDILLYNTNYKIHMTCTEVCSSILGVHLFIEHSKNFNC